MRLDLRLDEAEAEDIFVDSCILAGGGGSELPQTKNVNIDLYAEDRFFKITYPVGLDIEAVLFPFLLLRPVDADAGAGAASGASSDTFCRFDRRIEPVGWFCAGWLGVSLSPREGFLLRDDCDFVGGSSLEDLFISLLLDPAGTDERPAEA